MSKAITDIDDPRLVKALSHPLRIKIIGILERGTATPKELSRELDVPLENMSYHVRALRSLGFIELEDVRMVRGALEHRYRLAARPEIAAQAWESLPEVARRALETTQLNQLWDVVGAAAAQGKLDAPGAHVTRRCLQLDDEGFTEASALLAEALTRLADIERRAAERLDSERAATSAPAYLVAMLFDAPDAADGPKAPDGEGPPTAASLPSRQR